VAHAIGVRIGVDVSSWQDRRGFGRFTRELVSQLVDVAATHEFVLVADERTAADGALPARADVAVVPPGRHGRAQGDGPSWRSPAELARLGWRAARCGADVFWFPSVASYYPLPARVPVVVTVHDAMTEEWPALFFPDRRARASWRAKVWMARRQASVVVTPSPSARRAVARAWRWPEEDIAAIAEAPAARFRGAADPAAVASVLARHRLPSDVALILYVGGIDPHKNLDTLLRALPVLDTAGAPPWHLVLVGGSDGPVRERCLDELVRLRRSLSVDDRVTFTGFVPDDDLAALYHAATVLVLPSLGEGFGLPVMEAMASGLAVAVSARGALPDLVGDAGLTFEPLDPAAVAGALATLLGDDGLRRQLAGRGAERAASFTWAESARRMLAVLEATGAR